METNELKFLLKLLGCRDYRSPIADKTFNSFKGKDKICRDLGDRGLVDFSREIAAVKILPPGHALLKLTPDQLPITPSELKVLETIGKASSKIPPSKISASVAKATERDAILQRLGERGLIEVEIKMKRQKAEVWLISRGLEYLRDDYVPKKGTSPVVSLEMLANYLHFLRKPLHNQTDEFSTQAEPQTPPTSAPASVSKYSDEEILQIIRDLDYEQGTENYLPIFHLRQKLEPPLSREELDNALYRLEGDDQIELSALVEASSYSQEQVNAGIKQRAGSRLFFIMVVAT